MGHILLAGGAEFAGRMEEPDRMALARAGGMDAPVRIIPAAAAPDKNHRRAGQNGVDWFRSLGATDVRSLPLIDRTSANSLRVRQALRKARLIYMLGGFPHYLADSLRDTLGWKAVCEALRKGAVVGGSSAGAMVLCEHFFDPFAERIFSGLNLLKGACVIPHHERFGRHWVRRLQAALPEMMLVGIDEETGVLIDLSVGIWHVCGQGGLTVYYRQRVRRIGPNAAVEFRELSGTS